MLVTTECIVLRSRKQGDTSKIVSLYTREFGLLDVIAKGARDAKSKFGSSLEPFTCTMATFYKKEGKDLYLLSKAETKSAWGNLRSDLDHIEGATKVVELLLRAQHHEEGNLELYNLVKDSFLAMDVAQKGVGVTSILFAYYLQYMHLAGFEIRLHNAEAGERSGWYFDIEKGEAVCIQSASDMHSERLQRLTPEVLASIRHLERSGVRSAASLKLSAQARHSLEQLFRSYFSMHIEGMQHGRSKSGKVFSAMK